jgi:hypothetical protein
VVFSYEQEALRRPVAVKALRGRERTRATEELLNEARAMAQVGFHPTNWQATYDLRR